MSKENTEGGTIDSRLSALNITEDERISELKLLKASWDMYERTKKEAIERRSTATDKKGNKVYSEKDTKKTMELLETMQEDIKNRYLLFGGKLEDLLAVSEKKVTKKVNKDRMNLLRSIMEKEKEDIDNETEEEELGLINPETITNEEKKKKKKEPEQPNPVVEEKKEEPKEEIVNDNDDDDVTVTVNMANVRGKNIKYDVIPLPSKGECYKSKISKVPVGYLTAYDENLIISPNMYRDGTFLDHILKAKLMTNKVDPMELLPGDRDAIILWLRASGYGVDFPVNAVDNATGKEFQTTVDLTKLKYKKFKLKGDEDGFFDYKLPVSGDDIKFKFLTIGDIKRIEKMEEDEVAEVRKTRAVNLVDSLFEIIDADSEIDQDMKIKVDRAVNDLRNYVNSIDADVDKYSFSHSVTNRLAASIMSINGVTDRKYIEEQVMYMNVIDSSSLRKYISENEPGIDFNIKVDRPESLGGGSINMFLTIDQFIFLTVA